MYVAVYGPIPRLYGTGFKRGWVVFRNRIDPVALCQNDTDALKIAEALNAAERNDQAPNPTATNEL